MMTDSENKAQKFLRELYGENAFIRKIPDYKQTGMMLGGLPDYITICNSITRWYEIKELSKGRKSLSINDFTEQQLITINKMLKNNAKIYLIIYYDDGFILTDIKKVFKKFRDFSIKSISLKAIQSW